MSKEFTYAEIADVLSKYSENEDRHCKEFYEKNPDADDQRHYSSITKHITIVELMHTFKRLWDEKREV